MKKTLASALTAALVVGAASTTFAAANPFSDVPSDHWAYDAVAQLAQDGVIEGYGDTTFQGDKNITRYEMAQMVAKAMAKKNVGTNDKALIDKLAAEFSDELNNLGVRVSNLERNADKVAWHGTAEYTFHYMNKHEAKDKYDSRNNVLLRLLPDAEVNANWHVKARLDANQFLDEDSATNAEDNGNVALKRVWAEGHYGNMRYMAGKFEYPDPDTITDTVFSGVEVGYLPTQGVTFQVGAGRYNLGDHYYGDWTRTTKTNADGTTTTTYNNGTADVQYAHVGYNKNKFNAAVAYYHLGADNMDNYYEMGKYANSKTDDANIWTGKGGYQFDHNWGLKGFYAENTEADYYKKAGSVELDYKGSQLQNVGTYGVWVAYRHFGRNAFISSPWDVINLDRNGEKGWEVGGNFVPFVNTIVTLRYGNGEYLDNGKDVENLFGRVNFLF